MNFKKKYIKFAILFFTLLNINISFTRDVFFDLGEVLLEHSKIKAISKLGFKCFFYPNLQKDLFDFMCYIDSEYDDPEDSKTTYRGAQLPPLLCKYHKGKISCFELNKFIQENIEKHAEYFENQFTTGKTKKQLIKKSANLFLPENTVFITQPKKAMLKLVKEIKNKKDKKGKPEHKLGVISNHDWDTVKMLQKSYPEVFENFSEDRIIISSKVKMIKPNKNIFEYVKKKFKLPNKKNQKPVFIDDQIENVKAAEKCGFIGIHHLNANKTRRELKKLGVI